ncbi:MAG: sigma-70 family RNA polymerase sigma factor [Acidimicrobiales bacterium]|nr:sigma-70 family RNA polymerase sigma factor [Acidimicrobiales bacterium]
MADPHEPPHPLDRAVVAARSGESTGFDTLYRRLAGPITAFARTRGAADPEGVCNETFLRAFRSIREFEGDGAAFRRWSFSICRNQLIDDHRRRQRRPDEVLAEPPVITQPSAEDAALEQLAGTDVGRILRELTDEQREVIVLRLVADLSLADTAEIVGRPVTAVKRLQARALKRLQSEILRQEVS